VGDDRTSAHALDGHNVGGEVATATVLPAIILAPGEVSAAGQGHQGPAREGRDPDRLAGHDGPEADRSGADITPVAGIIRRLDAAHSQVEGLVQLAACKPKSPQTTHVGPFVIGNHDTQHAIGARLQNHVRRRQQGTAGIGDQAGAAKPGPQGHVVLGAQQRDSGAHGKRRRGRRRRRQSQSHETEKQRENALSPRHSRPCCRNCSP